MPASPAVVVELLLCVPGVFQQAGYALVVPGQGVAVAPAAGAAVLAPGACCGQCWQVAHAAGLLRLLASPGHQPSSVLAASAAAAAASDARRRSIAHCVCIQVPTLLIDWPTWTGSLQLAHIDSRLALIVRSASSAGVGALIGVLVSC